jgi:hypothetical protein
MTRAALAAERRRKETQAWSSRVSIWPWGWNGHSCNRAWVQLGAGAPRRRRASLGKSREVQQLLSILDQAYDRRSWHGVNLRGSIRGVSVTQACWRPGPARHNIWETVVHAAYWKYALWRRLTGQRRGMIVRSTFMPPILGVLLAIEGVCYPANRFADFVAPGIASRVFGFLLVSGIAEVARAPGNCRSCRRLDAWAHYSSWR